jgi:hypothetical protein
MKGLRGVCQWVLKVEDHRVGSCESCEMVGLSKCVHGALNSSYPHVMVFIFNTVSDEPLEHIRLEVFKFMTVGMSEVDVI